MSKIEEALALSDVRHYRQLLRMFTRVISTLQAVCCTEVTIPQCHVLMEVDEDKRMTVGQLATRLRLDKSTLSRTIESLVQMGLLERRREERDRRVVWVSLTPRGQASCDEIHDQYDARSRKIFDQIPRHERENVVRYFGMLVQAYRDREIADQEPASMPTGKGAKP